MKSAGAVLAEATPAKGSSRMDHTTNCADSASLPAFHSTGLPLFDAVRAAQARDAAIDQVEANAFTTAADAIRQAIDATARELEEFTSDQVWRRVPPEVRERLEPRLLGALMREAARREVIRAIPGMFRVSDMITCHKRPKQVWRSLSAAGS